MTPQLPEASGVYQIRCIPTGKIYIGSAVNLRKRWYQHCRTLRRGEHGNRYLQAAWAKFGEANFVFEILEFVSVSDLLLAEQEWIDSTACTDRSIGFNIRDTAESSGSFNAQVWEGFIDPNGNEVNILNLHDFCRQQGLNFTAMRQLFKGTSKLKSHKGWTHRNSVRLREYVKTYEGFIDPEGNLVPPITNLAEFCRQHNLDNTHMLAVMRGRICSHRGWTHEHSREPRNYKIYTGFVKPNGERVTITNLAQYCRSNQLHQVKMRQLISGYIQSYRGWTWREEEQHGN